MPAARCRVRAHGKTAGIELPAVFPAGLVRLPRRYFLFVPGRFHSARTISGASVRMHALGALIRARQVDACRWQVGTVGLSLRSAAVLPSCRGSALAFPKWPRRQGIACRFILSANGCGYGSAASPLKRFLAAFLMRSPSCVAA